MTSFNPREDKSVGCPTKRTLFTLSSNFNSHNSGLTANNVERTSSDNPVRFPLVIFEVGSGKDFEMKEKNS